VTKEAERRAPPGARVLVVDDEESMRWFVSQGLTRHGYAVELAGDAGSAARALAQGRFDAAVVDVRLPGEDGMSVLQQVRSRSPSAVVVMMTAYGSIPAAVDAIKRGAFDYLSKPFEVAELLAVLERGLRERGGRATGAGAPAIVAESAAMRALLARIEQVKDVAASVLITGESGSGKELAARALHARSARGRGPFVAVNCAALHDALITSELFGHEPGAFTGAVGKRTGVLVRADGGTLFLDEIGELRPESQAKLERFLQDREVVPLGGDAAVKVDVRVCAATSRDLAAMVDQGLFRRELYFRLAVVPLAVPPLRERIDDIPALAQQSLERARGAGSGLEGFTTAAMAAVQGYAWPGNVRELQNLIERVAVLHGDKEAIDFDDLPEELRTAGRARVMKGFGGVVEYEHALVAFERDYITSVLQRVNGNISEAARLAGLSRGHLHRKVKQLGIEADEFRK
jgi:DNA-binding NtrC family response regulator